MIKIFAFKCYNLPTMILIANWKSTIPKNVNEYLRKVDRRIIIAPPMTHIPFIKNNTAAAQSCSLSKSITGEVHFEVLKDMGLNFCIIGHYERRKYFNETREESYEKAAALVKLDIIPILCCDEKSIEEDIQFAKGKNITLAYEPVESIGTGSTLSPEKVEHIVENVKSKCRNKVIYGGSVSSKNARHLIRAGVDGLIVGRLSLDFKEINRIAELVPIFD